MIHKQYITEDTATMSLAEPQVAYGTAVTDDYDTPDEFGVTPRMIQQWIDEAEYEEQNGLLLTMDEVEEHLNQRLGWYGTPMELHS